MTNCAFLLRFVAGGLAAVISVGCAPLPDRSQANLQPGPPVDYDPATDNPVLERVRGDVKDAWPKIFPPPPEPHEDDDMEGEVETLASSSLEMLGPYPPVIEVKCQNSSECKIPVLIRTRKRKDNGERVCFAVLPFYRYAVLKSTTGEPEPQRITFYLARWDVRNKEAVALKTDKFFRFNGNTKAPLVGAEAGVFLHKLEIHPVKKHSVRSDLGGIYFSRDKLNSDNLHSVWKIGRPNTWSAAQPYVGAVLGGVMAMPLVLDMDRVRAQDHDPFCKPIDPIIVNVKN